MTQIQEMQQQGLTQVEIGRRVFELYDEYCHGRIDRREFFARSSAITVAGVPFYGAAAETASVPKIKAPLLIHYAENDERINAVRPAFEAALKASGVHHEKHTYPGIRHGFHINSTPR